MQRYKIQTQISLSILTYQHGQSRSQDFNDHPGYTSCVAQPYAFIECNDEIDENTFCSGGAGGCQGAIMNCGYLILQL